MPVNGQGVVEFQLYLLQTMNPPGQLLARALEQLGRTSKEKRDRYEVISQLIRPGPDTVRNIKGILEDAHIADLSDGCSPVLVYSFQLWPEFFFTLSFYDQGPFTKRAGFERRPGGTAPVDGVNVWNFLKVDMNDWFTNIQQVDIWGHYETFLAHDLRDERQYFLRFCWGLLQEVELMAGD